MAFQPAPRKIILDTDPGGDDTFALFWLLSLAKQGLAEVVAVTSTGGNVSPQNTFTNASKILDLMGFNQIEVGRGVAVNTTEDAAYIHGADGIGNLSTTLPPSARSYETARYSDDLMIERLNAEPDEITIVAIGPLTNLSAAEAKNPGILKQAKEIVIMGGAIHCPGNVTSQAEFNIWFNPEATAIVFNSCQNIVLLPLDVTRQLIFTRTMAQSVQQVNSKSSIASFLIALYDFMAETALSYRETNSIDGFLVHDAITLGYLFYPEVLTFQRARVWVETKGEWTRGQTLIDRRCSAKPEANAWVALHVDEHRFFTCLVEDLKREIGAEYKV